MHFYEYIVVITIRITSFWNATESNVTIVIITTVVAVTGFNRIAMARWWHVTMCQRLEDSTGLSRRMWIFVRVLFVRQVNNHNNSIYLYVLTFYNHRYVITININQAHFLWPIKTSSYVETFNKIHSPTANYNAWPGNLYFFLLYTVDKFIFTPCIIFVVLHLERISPISNSSRHSRV